MVSAAAHVAADDSIPRADHRTNHASAAKASVAKRAMRRDEPSTCRAR